MLGEYSLTINYSQGQETGSGVGCTLADELNGVRSVLERKAASLQLQALVSILEGELWRAEFHSKDGCGYCDLFG